MSEKFIEIKEGIYVVTEGNFKILKGHFTEDKLKEIYQIAQKIENINEEKKYYEKELSNVQIAKNNAKNAWVMRSIPMITGIISLTAAGFPSNLVSAIFLLSAYAGFQILVEKAIKMICGTKNEREEMEKTATSMLASLNHHLKIHEETLKQLKEKTQYEEISYEGNIIAKPNLHSIDIQSENMEITSETSKQEKTWNDVLYTEEEIHQYMQMSEPSAPFNLETIFGENETIEEQIETQHQKQRGPVLTKKLTLPRNTENK